MDADRWARLETLFHAALEHPPEEREDYLRAVEPDETLRADVLRLLEADADPRTLDPGLTERLSASDGPEPTGPEALSPAVSSLEGRQIGPYRVLRRLGQGGMGAVYLAERDDVDRQVALKLVRGAMGEPERIHRFLRERRVLAQLDHPNIARLLDAGVTSDETPYFAMEYVEGQAITDYCRRVEASTRTTLELFRDVCAAVSYAHAALVVHRDIKPSNVMVAGDGTVKLLDFGIAKLLDEDQDGAYTRTGVRVMSPAYAAPEQRAGEPVTTATDVYALGVLLRELLTGERQPGPGRGDEASDPSTGPDNRQAVTLPGDLEAICQRAAAPEPERRYRTAEQLREDITRYLTGRPVEARLPTLAYRTGKFLRRHAAAVAGGVLLVLSLGGGLGVALLEAQRAERSRVAADSARAEAETALSRSETVTGFLTRLFEAADPNESRGEEVTAVELVDRGVERVDELEDDPPLQARLLETLSNVNIQLGRYDRASGLMERAVAIRRSLDDDSTLVVALNTWGGTFFHRGLPDSATLIWEQALDLSRRALGPKNEESLALMNNLAITYERLGRSEEARALLRELIGIEREVYDADDPTRGYALNNLGVHLARNWDFAGAEPLLRESLQLRLAANGEENLGTAMYLDNLGMMLREDGRYDEAEPFTRRGLKVRLKFLGDDHRYTGESLFALGTLLAVRGRPEDLDTADSLLHRTVDLYTAALGADHPATAYPLHSLGVLAEQRGDLAAAEDWYRKALELRLNSDRDSPAVTVKNLADLSSVLRRRGAYSEARSRGREALDLAEEWLPETHPLRGVAEAQLGLVLVATGDTEAGAAHVRDGLATIAAGLRPGHPIIRRLCDAAADVGVPNATGLEGCQVR